LIPRYYVIGARPSVGKTAEICDLVSAVSTAPPREGRADGISLVFSLEMPADDLRERCLSALSGVQLSGFKDSPYTISELEAVTDAQQQMQGWKWWINDNPETSISDIEAQTISLYRDIGYIDMVAIDYLQLIRIFSKRDRWEQVAELSRRIKSLGRNVNTAMIALSQLKRAEGVWKKELGRTVPKTPELQDLREAGDIEQDADVVQFINRDIMNDPENAEFIIAKQRGGRTDTVKMKYNPGLTSFSDAEEVF
jgi:replicative DNA helicase